MGQKPKMLNKIKIKMEMDFKRFLDTYREWKISYHVWSTDGRLVALRWRERHTLVWWTAQETAVRHGRLWDRTYWLGRVHVWITPREVRSVCGQHDFVDLLRLNNAIFCRVKKINKSLVIVIMHDDWWDTHYVTVQCIEDKRRRASYTWMHRTKGVLKSRHGE